jgi:hypothetical protein
VQLELVVVPGASVQDVALNALAPSVVPDVARLTVPVGWAGLVPAGEVMSVTVTVQLDWLWALSVDGAQRTAVEVLSGGGPKVTAAVALLVNQLGAPETAFVGYVALIVGDPATDCV